jgi:hypothetical protein
MSVAKNRLATAFANIGLDKTRKQLDAIKTRTLLPVSGENEKATKKPTVGDKTIVKKTTVKPTIVEKTTDKPTIAKTNIVKKTKVAEQTKKNKTTAKETVPPSPPPLTEQSGKTIVKKTKVKPTIVKKTLLTPEKKNKLNTKVSLPPSPPPLTEQPEKTTAKTTTVQDVKKTNNPSNNTTIANKPERAPSEFWGAEDIWDLVDHTFPNYSPNEITAYITLLRESYGRNSRETGFISLNKINRKSFPTVMETLKKTGLATLIETSPKQGNRYRIRALTLDV